MRIDLHNHTTLSSACSILDVRDLIRIAMESGLDGICVTEHNTMSGGEIAEEIGREMGFLVIAGQEVATREGDILAFGVEREGLNSIALAELGRIAAEDGGVLIPAHPFRTQALSVGEKIFEFGHLFTAVEGLNGNLDEKGNRKAQEAAAKLNLPCTGGSDAHSKEMVAKYCTEFEEGILITDRESLVAALKSRRYRPAAINLQTERRKWSMQS